MPSARIAVLGDEALRASVIALGFEPCDADPDAIVVDLRDAAAVRRAAAMPTLPRIFVGSDEERPLVAALGLDDSFVAGTEPARIGPALMRILPARTRTATRMVVVTSARGGVGRTLLVTNLARRIAKRRRVWLIDATGSGAAAWWLGADPRSWATLESLASEMSVEQLALAADETVAGVHCVGGGGAAPTSALLLAATRVALTSDDLVLVDAPIVVDALTGSLAPLTQRTLFLSYDEPLSVASLPTQSDDVWLIASQCERPRIGERGAFRALPRDEAAVAAAISGRAAMRGALGRAYDDLAELLLIDAS
jgi:hypothetical protein